MLEKIDLSTFENDSEHFGDFNLLVTIKSFDLQAIRARYVESKKNKSGRRGSVERRDPGVGGLAYLSLKNGKLETSEVLHRLKEPRAIDVSGNRIALGAEDTVYVFENGNTYRIKYPWFSYIHTVAFNPRNPNAVLIASSGLDCIFEFDYRSGKLLWEWFAWENGFNKSFKADGSEQYLCRTLAQANTLRADGKEPRWIKDPAQDFLPTAERAAFINSVAYRADEVPEILATFFHEGKMFRINRETGVATPQISALKSPHGGKHLGENHWLVTSTATGEVVVQNDEKEMRVHFGHLPNKAEEMGSSEWLQNTDYHEGVFMTVDSNRNAFVLFDIQAKKMSAVPYDGNWAVQDLVVTSLSKVEIKRATLL